ncbi:MAG TPA: hypothetical protein VEC60_21700 [Reyranella sp.]|nr:hypothetical protein [Reyranella sp.]
MTKSIAFATLIAATVAGCAKPPVPPPAVAVEPPAVSSFVPYCGPVWLVSKQGYVDIPCPPGSNYPGGGR